MASSLVSAYVTASIQRPPVARDGADRLGTSFPSAVKPLGKVLRQVPLKAKVEETIKKASVMVLDAFVDLFFMFSDQEYLPSQKNFVPVEEIGDAVFVTCVEGELPTDFPEGIFIRNGGNPMFGAPQTATSPFGVSKESWVEGDGMLHTIFFKKGENGSDLQISYKNRFVEPRSYKEEKKRNKPTFIPAIDGNPAAILAAFFLNHARFGTINKHISNTSLFTHGGKLYATAENYTPVEIDTQSLGTVGDWHLRATWGRPLTSHPKRAPGSGELVVMGVSTEKPFLVVGVISADGKNLVHKVNARLKRSIVTHDIGVTERYNVLIDHPLTLNARRILRGDKLLKYEKDGYTRIGVMPRYGDSSSIRWFDVESNCILHILNCFEDGDEVVMRGCRARAGIIAGPENFADDIYHWYSRGFKHVHGEIEGDSDQGYLFHRVHEWRLNMVTGLVKEHHISGADFSMDFPFINENLTGLKHKYGYTQVVDLDASSEAGLCKYGGLAKLYFDEPPSDPGRQNGPAIKLVYHGLGKNNFYSGSVFVPKPGGNNKEDDGWIVAFVHNEETNLSQVHVIDAKNFEGEPVAKISLPQRVPYGFHATFVKKLTDNIM